MKKAGKLFDAEHQLCIVHGLQLAVIEVLYKKQPKHDADEDGEETVIDITEDDLEYDDWAESLVVDENNSEPNELTDDFSILELIQKVRSVVKMFRRSPTKNDEVLQKYVVEEFKKDFSLILDCKTRWSSLLAMLERFNKLQNCIRKALIDIKSNIVFSDVELETIATLLEILLPVKLAVEALCREDANLLTAITTLEFLMANIGSGTVLHDKMQSALKRRISERLTDLFNVMQYLHNGKFVSSNLGLRKMSKDILVKTIVRLLHQSETEKENVQPEQDLNDVADDDTPVSYGPVTLKEQLQMAIGNRQTKIIFLDFYWDFNFLLFFTDEASAGFERTDPSTPRDFNKVIKREMAVLEDGGGRGFYLTKLYNFLLTIKPTSVDAERAFSNAGLICTKVRSRLSDLSIDALSFLRSHFQKIKAKNLKKKKVLKTFPLE